jgi:fido (protein-threonine AMPylation protein)
MRSLDVPASPWLDQLLDEIETWADLLATTAPADEAVGAARDAAAVATLRLDGSPITAVPPPVGDLPVGRQTGPARGGWLEVLRAGTTDLEAAPDEVLLAVEHHGARRGLDADDLVVGLRTDPLPALRALHVRVTDGLLAPDTAGAPRRTSQTVHDASVGRVLFFPVDPAKVVDRLARAADWVATSDAHPVVVSGVLHHQVLDIHPFEAANGRLARIAARLLLAGAGIDVRRATGPETVLLGDSIGYLDEVARSRRLGDPTAFVARWAEAVAAALRTTVRDLGAAPAVEVPHATVTFLADHAGRDFTIADHRAAGGQDAGLDAALAAGLAERVVGTRGLHWTAPATVGG